MGAKKISDAKSRGYPYGYREIRVAILPIQYCARKGDRQYECGKSCSLRLMLGESKEKYEKRNNENARSAPDKSRQASAEDPQKNVEKCVVHIPSSLRKNLKIRSFYGILLVL